MSGKRCRYGGASGKKAEKEAFSAFDPGGWRPASGRDGKVPERWG